MSNLRVLGRTTSINVRKVLWTLAELEMEFDHEDHWAGPKGDTKSTDYLAMNPNGLVPVIEDENGLLWESNTICRYLALKAGREDLLPAEIARRAQVEKWMDWQSTQLNDAYRHAFMWLVRKNLAFDDDRLVKDSARRWNEAMSILDVQLAGTGAHVCGDNFTLADIVLALATHRWRKTPIEREDFPAVEGWMARLVGRKGYQLYCAPDIP